MQSQQTLTVTPPGSGGYITAALTGIAQKARVSEVGERAVNANGAADA